MVTVIHQSNVAVLERKVAINNNFLPISYSLAVVLRLKVIIDCVKPQNTAFPTIYICIL